MNEEIKAFSTEGKKSTVDHYMESDNVRLAIMTSTIYAILVDKGIFTEDEYNETSKAIEAKLYKMFV